MAATYERTTGDLADRMLGALDAAQAIGGDVRAARGSQCADADDRSHGMVRLRRRLSLKSGQPLAPVGKIADVGAVPSRYASDVG